MNCVWFFIINFEQIDRIELRNEYIDNGCRLHSLITIAAFWNHFLLVCGCGMTTIYVDFSEFFISLTCGMATMKWSYRRKCEIETKSYINRKSFQVNLQEGKENHKIKLECRVWDFSFFFYSFLIRKIPSNLESDYTSADKSEQPE